MANFKKILAHKLIIHHAGEPFLRDTLGYIITNEEMEIIVSDVADFYKTYDDNYIKELNKEIDRQKKEEYEHVVNRPEEPKKPKHSDGYVYFAKNEDNKIKIGRTINLKSRMKSLNTSSPHTIDLVAYIKSSSCVELEELAQEYFLTDNIKGEWFSITKDDMCDFANDLNLEIAFVGKEDSNVGR